MAKAIETVVYGIKCDNPKCGWKDMSVEYKDYPSYVNKPCPCCGSNLLTEHDFSVINIMMKLSNLFGNIEVPDEAIDTSLSLELNGTNEVCITTEKIR